MSFRFTEDKKVAIAWLFTIAVFAADFLSPLWYQTWVLYLAPLFIMYRCARRPYLFSVVISLLAAARVFVAPSDSIMFLHAAANRLTGIAGGWAVSFFLMQLRRMHSSLLQARNELEKRVEERTSELTKANASLQKEIADRLKAEEALCQSEEFIRNILNNVDAGFIVLDRDLKIVSANTAYCVQTGTGIGAVIGKHCFEVSHRSDVPCYQKGEDCAVVHTFMTGESCTAVHKHEDADGNVAYIETRSFPMIDSDNKITSVIETMHNITEKRLLEAEQLKSQKLEAIGTLAGGIAHDFNNLLQGVFGYISLAKISLDRKDKAASMLDQAEKALNMSVNLTNQLLTFSKGGRPTKKTIDLRPVIENSARFALSGARCDHEISIVKDLWNVEADNGQMGQVIQNIVLNASDAMPQGGTVRISAENIVLPKAGHSSSFGKGKFVKIDIKDAGIGVPEEHLSKIFDPYFTTKQKGSGLGLATSYSIVKNHDGIIDVTSELGKGSTFSIWLRASSAEAEGETRFKAPAAGRKGKILVMDDEEMMRSVITEMICALGHEVECAADGPEAIEKISQAKESTLPFEIAILDLTIKGGMGGEQVARRLSEIDPAIKMVVSSGYADNPVSSDFSAHGFSACLNKPYNLDGLKSTLNSLLT